MKKPSFFLQFFILLICSASCSKLTDVTDVKPVYQLSEEEAITTVAQAQSVLLGTYGIMKSGLEIITSEPGLTALRGLTMSPGTRAGASEASYANNEVLPSDSHLDGIYTLYYKVINNANHIILRTPLIETTEPRKNEILGEARFLRALCHFNLLRMYGYFFDLNSPYGIVIKDKPIISARAEPRATVQESYDFILADVDAAIQNAPSFTNTFYASKEAAKALKAKVLLYQKKYAEAAVLAKEVIQAGKFQLESKFGDVFSKKITNTREVIFQLPFDERNDRNNKAFIFRSSYMPSNYYADALLGDNRDTAALLRNVTGTLGPLRNRKFNGIVFNGQPLTADTRYFFRLAEMYLLQAEAIVRSNGNLDEAIAAINTVRTRAQMPGTTAATASELLEAIRMEKILELGAEEGEEWYDLVRYAVEGDLTITAFKSGVTSPARYVLPIPFASVQLSQNLVVQNPGY